METAKKVTDQEAKWLAVKNDKERRNARLAELRSSIREQEAEYQKAKMVAPEAQVLVDQWTGNILELKQRFVHGLAARAAQGKTPVISFDSPEALAFLNADCWINAFPSLAEEVLGRKGISFANRATMLQIIEDELSELRSEYAALGGV